MGVLVPRYLLEGLSLRRLLRMVINARACVAFRAPHEVAAQIAQSMGVGTWRVIVMGPHDRRRLIAYGPKLKGFVASFDGTPCGDGVVETGLGFAIEQPGRWWSPASFTHYGIFLLTRPRIKLLALCHKERFPMPRFSLGISDLATNIRQNHLGQVSLMDMQIGDTIPEMVQACVYESTDIIGISVTFGQQDLLEELLEHLATARLRAVIVVGGALGALNSSAIVRRYPQLIVARVAGESVLPDLVRYWRGECGVKDINGVELIPSCHAMVRNDGNAKPLKHDNHRAIPLFTGSRSSFDVTWAWAAPTKSYRPLLPLPELDLLPKTIACDGVMQLESSRGCSFRCSFCPRDHKGIWYANDATIYENFMLDVASAYALYPDAPRKIFLVDEESFGYSEDAEDRVLRVAKAIHSAGFRFETSARIDQVYRPDKNTTWHTNRIEVWRKLVSLGLDRCLFGVESGVESVLKRFRKQITARQNVTAIRLLALYGIPVRYTYITLDPLMDFRELVETYRFQGRTDLLLTPQPQADVRENLAIALDDSASAARTQGLPLYTNISYMLVSLECLVGSDYLHDAESLGLAGVENLLMGKRDVKYVDPIIGLISHHAQLWIDRNFALDYALKSLTKICTGDTRNAITAMRVTLKEHAYCLLGLMLVTVSGDATIVEQRQNTIWALDLASTAKWKPPSTLKGYTIALRALMEQMLKKLMFALEEQFDQLDHALDTRISSAVRGYIVEWQKSRDWELING